MSKIDLNDIYKNMLYDVNEIIRDESGHSTKDDRYICSIDYLLERLQQIHDSRLEEIIRIKAVDCRIKISDV